ncbi:hypothetical protein A8W50_003562, partial [Escherichia coli]|nr:hypothetical protein [Escherichia coli]
MNDIRLKFRTAVRVTVPVTDGWPDAIACTQSAQTDFSGTVKQTGTPGAQVIIRNGTTPRQRPGRRVILVPESRLQGHAASALALQQRFCHYPQCAVEL